MNLKVFGVSPAPAGSRNTEGSMNRFVKVSDEGKGSFFINLDQVTAVDCFVEKTNGGLNIESVGVGKKQTSSPGKTIAVVELRTANGTGFVKFGDFSEANAWLQKTLDITVPFDQLG
jgi:hypothetical protein